MTWYLYSDGQQFHQYQQNYGVECHFKQYFSYLVAVGYIGGGYKKNFKKTIRYDIQKSRSWLGAGTKIWQC
jgi:hypothetical protein